ncbi:hypothetical protein N8198_07490 [Gammaproteobacteria bacterium]|nr:hypothetical protein [Gammaproteobacteria bacterium]
MGNTLAFLALIAWPFISIFFYKRFDQLTATFCTIVGGLLILPVQVQIDFPLIPPLDKTSISALSALFCLRFVTQTRIRLLPITRAEKLLSIAFLLVPLVTMFNNQESIVSRDGIVKLGLTYSDAVSSIFENYIILVPFIIGILIVRTYEDQVKIFKLAAIAGLIYSIPILFEVRFSPQLHWWTYGFFPHDFAQQKRYDGFRPVVFLGHGLLVAMFITTTLGSAISLWREKQRIFSLSNTAVVAYLLVILVLCKSAGALLLGVFLLIAIRSLNLNNLIRGAMVISSIFFLYPLLSMGNLFPHDFLVDLAKSIDPERAGTLQFRFKHEAALLDHALQKLFFGWGGWNRNRLDGSITDGAWIITLGKYGLFGFCALFGLALLAIGRGFRSIKLLSEPKMKHLVAAHALIISIILVDQIPNSSLNVWTWFLTGALIGRTIGVKEDALKNSIRKTDDSVNQ